MTLVSTGAPPSPPPSETSHLKHPGHNLTLVPTGPAKFKCDGCHEHGTGGDRHTCLQPSCNFDLHKDCALAQPTLVHPLLQGSTFELGHGAPRTKRKQLCNACGGYVQGLHYHCQISKYYLMYLQPCCAKLPPEIRLRDQLTFELRSKVSHCCTKCGKGGGVRDCWFYRSTCKTVYLHVRCVIEAFLLPSSNTTSDVVDDNGRLARFVNETALRKHVSGKAGRTFDAICEIVKALASIILSVIAGRNPLPAISAGIDLCANLAKLKTR